MVARPSTSFIYSFEVPNDNIDIYPPTYFLSHLKELGIELQILDEYELEMVRDSVRATLYQIVSSVDTTTGEILITYEERETFVPYVDTDLNTLYVRLNPYFYDDSIPQEQREGEFLLVWKLENRPPFVSPEEFEAKSPITATSFFTVNLGETITQLISQIDDITLSQLTFDFQIISSPPESKSIVIQIMWISETNINNFISASELYTLIDEIKVQINHDALSEPLIFSNQDNPTQLPISLSYKQDYPDRLFITIGFDEQLYKINELRNVFYNKQLEGMTGVYPISLILELKFKFEVYTFNQTLTKQSQTLIFNYTDYKTRI